MSRSGRKICCRPIFGRKQSRHPVDLTSTCHPSPIHATFDFRSREVKRLLLDLYSYGGTDPLGMFPPFLKKTAEVLAHRLAWYFGCSFVWVAFLFAGEWRMLPQFQRVHLPLQHSNYRPISLTPILSMVFERLVSVRLRRFMEGRDVLPTTQFAYRNGLGTCDALLCVAHTLQIASEMGQEVRIIQIDFSAAFDRVSSIRGFSSSSVLWELEGSVLSVLTQFLSNRSQYVVVDGCRSKLVNVVSGVPHGSVLSIQMFLFYMQSFSL